MAAPKWHRGWHITNTHQLLPDPWLCCHSQGTQHPIPTCLPSSHFPFLVENLSLPDISQAENHQHSFHLAVAITSPVQGLLDFPPLCKAAALWGPANISGQRGKGTGGQDPAETGRLLPGLVLGMLSYNLTRSSGAVTG